jgi:lysophospholipid acyltransferase (LPLAT)-like uncharacterized protein
VFKKLRDKFWLRAEPWHSFRYWLIPRLMRAVHCTLMCTLRIEISGTGPAWQHMKNGREGRGCGPLFVLWHDMSFLPLHLFREQNIGVMMSTSRAGKMQAAFWSLYGWPIVWGSTDKREGIQALRKVLDGLRSGQSFAFTPDGPKGPRHQAHPGAIYLASKAPTVVLPLSVAASQAWYLPTWDRYMIPKPFARIHVHIGEPLEVPQNLSKEQTAHWQEIIAERINAADEEAQRRLNAKM